MCVLCERVPLTDEGRDDVLHALQEAGQVLCGAVMRGGDLSHDRCRLRSRRLRTRAVRQDVRQTQDPVHLTNTTHL